ncbi:MAG TPA: bifunctional methylenetetrahydrofolate dehydrogenase/methenyltetrahydrofolate cyclohydrolase FolD, partial [Thermoanaerobaculia bacterium]|nr:bifunctional methylenetetrahydrofolate dehydrogenase/methenyltetrahydrofolate cyclohydrolase FolD [Thermoanaerobaculia bacterium]
GRRAPGLAAVLVGDDPASQVYVSSKVKGCAEVGMESRTIRLPATTTEDELLALVDSLNRDEAVDGILVQLPLPRGVNERRVLDRVDPDKDVDGFHPMSVGRLWLDQEGFVSATPFGILELLRRNQIPLAGRHAVVVGRSAIVGKPMSALLLRENCTVSICHSRTRDLAAITRQADVLVAAVGRPAFLGADHVREGAVVIDVGINRVQDPLEVERLFPGDEARRQQLAARGSTIVGDVDFTRVAPIASAITPVPGGVGPLTVAMVLANTLNAARRRQGLSTFQFGAVRT